MAGIQSDELLLPACSDDRHLHRLSMSDVTAGDS